MCEQHRIREPHKGRTFGIESKPAHLVATRSGETEFLFVLTTILSGPEGIISILVTKYLSN